MAICNTGSLGNGDGDKGICDIFDKERSDGVERTGGGIRRRNHQVSFLVTDFSEIA